MRTFTVTFKDRKNRTIRYPARHELGMNGETALRLMQRLKSRGFRATAHTTGFFDESLTLAEMRRIYETHPKARQIEPMKSVSLHENQLPG